jgi:hypothetical protein
MLKRLLLVLPLLCFGGLFPSTSAAQSESLPRFAVGVSASSLGIGVQAATSVTHNSNVRFGVNGFDYSYPFTKDGVKYDAKLSLRSAQVTFDQYIGSVFHISPGMLLYNGNKASATATVAGGQSFSLGNANYLSGSTNPITGAGSLTLNKVAPMLLIGFGNMLPRNQKHFGLNFDVGVAFQGSPKVALNLSGNACLTSAQVACLNAAADSTVQANVTAEQTKINNDLTPFKFYPVVALTFSYKF